MAIDWGNALSMGATGAGAGAALGPLGAAIGGGVGVLTGLFGGADKPPPNRNYEDPTTSAAIQQLLTQKLGQKQANKASADLRSQAGQQLESAKENPNFQGNASVLSALNNRLQRQAESGTVNAQLKGAEVDQNAATQAAQLSQQQQQTSLNRNAQDMQRYQQGLQPSFLQDLFGKGVNAAVGIGLGKAGATQPKTQEQLDQEGGDIADNTVNNSRIPLPMPTEY